MTVRIALYFFFLPKATEAWIGTILSTQVTKGGCSMSIEIACIIGIAAAFLLGYGVRELQLRLKERAGELVIDKTGETDRWTYIFDKPIDDVEESTYVWLSVKKKE